MVQTRLALTSYPRLLLLKFNQECQGRFINFVDRGTSFLAPKLNFIPAGWISQQKKKRCYLCLGLLFSRKTSTLQYV